MKKIDTRRKRADGVRTLEDIRLRCRIDPVTDCWIWKYAMVKQEGKEKPVSRVWLPQGLDGKSTPCVGTAQRAAWTLSGRELKPHQVVYRIQCTHPDCVNPQHQAAGTRAEMFEKLAATGRLKGNPKRILANAKNRLRMVTSPERVKEAEALFAAGLLQKEVRARLGMSQETAARIRRGVHPNSTKGHAVLRGASVFNARGIL